MWQHQTKLKGRSWSASRTHRISPSRSLFARLDRFVSVLMAPDRQARTRRWWGLEKAGRRLYWAGVIVLVVTLRQRRAEGTSLSRLQKRFGVSRSTVARWMAWFAEVFPTTALWKRIRGMVSPTVRDEQLPDSLVSLCESSAADPQTALVDCLKLLAV